MVAEYVTSLKVALDLAKAVKASTDAIDDAQIKLQIADLISALADAKVAAAGSGEKIASLERQLRSKQAMEFNGSVYYRKLQDGSQEGPWCATCFDARGLDIRLQKFVSQGGGYGNWRCNECGDIFR